MKKQLLLVRQMSKLKIIFIIPVILGILAISSITKTNDSDYGTAILLAEKKFESFKIKRNDYKLIKIENDVLVNADNWELSYLGRDCLSKEGLKNCKGGEIILTINIKTKMAIINWRE